MDEKIKTIDILVKSQKYYNLLYSEIINKNVLYNKIYNILYLKIIFL